VNEKANNLNVINRGAMNIAAAN